MGNISILDCTLRDGGYINNWRFGKSTINSIIDRLLESKIDVIEIGFLDDRVEYDENCSIQPSTSDYEKVVEIKEHRGSMFVAMIDYGTCDIDNVDECKNTFIDGIRLIFKKEKYPDALDYSKKLIEKGYKVFLQMVSITSYSDEDIFNFINDANVISPYAVSIVDTYGLMHKEQVLHYLSMLDEGLSDGITIGYHSHNNFQLGYANSIEFIDFPSKHDKIVDGTLYGMGKSAGNAPIELIAMYMNDNHGTDYKISSIMEAIDNNIMQFYLKKQWGYNLLYYISALNDCHPNYVKYLLDKNMLSVKSINEILSSIDCEKKLSFDREHIESKYVHYQSLQINDSDHLKKIKAIFGNKKILLIGLGRSVSTEKERICEFISSEHPIVISLNVQVKLIKSNYIFVSNSKRYNLNYLELSKSGLPIIGTSNITQLSGCTFSFIFNYSELVKMDDDGWIFDNSLSMMLELLCRVGCKDVYLAGFDGYTGDLNNDYYDADVAFLKKIDAEFINDKMKKCISDYSKKIQMTFITKSRYVD